MTAIGRDSKNNATVKVKQNLVLIIVSLLTSFFASVIYPLLFSEGFVLINSITSIESTIQSEYVPIPHKKTILQKT